MALIEWSDELSVGIDEIDDQHKVLVGLVNSMDEAIHSHEGKTASAEILNQLVEYTRIHFATEESLMRIFDYPDYDEHKAQHETLLQEAGDLQKKVAAGAAISFQLLHFLKMWLTQHILDSDKQYTKHFVGHGIKSQSGSSGGQSWFSRIWPW